VQLVKNRQSRTLAGFTGGLRTVREEGYPVRQLIHVARGTWEPGDAVFNQLRGLRRWAVSC
jgi:hypothetical protein